MNPIRVDTSGSGLEEHGIFNAGTIHWNLPTSRLYEESIRRGEGEMIHLGPLSVKTGQHTGRSPNDRFIVKEPSSESNIWWSNTNVSIDPEKFDAIHAKLLAYCQGRDLFVQNCYAGADPDHRMSVRVINEKAWHNIFVRNMFIQIRDPEELANHKPEFTIIGMPGFHADPEIDGTRSETFILVNIAQKLVLIGGSAYGGEMKKSIFTVLNYLLPQEGVLSMHCSANVGPDGDSALFFGLSGTGKTTLSADPERSLIGDDEHGWSDNGIFNFEGGCYAKVIKLSKEAEPEIYECTRKFGTVLENVIVDPETRRVDLDDGTLTENTRASYPLTYIPNTVRSGRADHPKTLIMLTCDAFGVMPPVAKLTRDEAVYHFLSGYTAKVAGTERGVDEPQATFSTCFGAPFMILRPTVYAKLLGERIERHDVSCWLVNTGWIGGAYGVGNRVSIKATRAIIHAILDGRLEKLPMRQDPNFGFQVPTECPDVDSKILDPRGTWTDPAAFDKIASDLAKSYIENFKMFEHDVTAEVLAAGPKTG